jgi:arginase
MRVALIYASWPVTPYGATWYKLADCLRTGGLREALQAAGHEVEEHTASVTGPQAGELRGAFELAGDIARHSSEAHAGGALPVVICGSCAVAAVGAMAGFGEAAASILWMDAHPDLNTPETSGSGMLDGMALAIALGKCWKLLAHDVAGLKPEREQDVCLFGARDIDPGEKTLIEGERMAVTDMAADAAALLASAECLYIHLDMDVHDALQVRANSFAVPGGPSIDEVRATLTQVAAAPRAVALSITGLDPAAPDAALAIETAIAHIRTVCDSRSAAQC